MDVGIPFFFPINHSHVSFSFSPFPFPLNTRLLQSLVIRVVVNSESLVNLGPLEDRIAYFAQGISKRRTVSSVITIILAWLLVHPWGIEIDHPGPNVAHLVSMVRRFEPLMYASENVIPRSRELSDASIAVEDLGESIRASNMSGSKVIISQLDDLGQNLKMLSDQITSFFVHVDGDMDG